MSETKNLNGKAGIEKIRSLTEGKVCMFSTYTDEYSTESRPMTVLGVDDEGAMWFLCDEESDIAKQAAAQPNVDLLYADISSNDYLAVKGNATVTRDQAAIDKYWSAFAKAYFEGKDDPRIRTVKVEPSKGHYWESKDGKILSLAKILITAATGAKLDEARVGDIKV